eukprot:TRINITY_DN887_c0_g1_i1.p1 TRINITY_DN887_c0_g1~~TRINITY_DN887_c0_g1_i1.p1  ORF type:complete len:1009 (-),score=197.61 TRINITY_DN887_c0_g1_i1:30-3056(-)
MEAWREDPRLLRRLENDPEEIQKWRSMSVEEFRDYFFGTPLLIEKRIESVFSNNESNQFPEDLMGELLRYIEITGNLQHLSMLLKSTHPYILLHLLKNHPAVFELNEEGFQKICEHHLYGEIVYRLCSTNWRELDQADKWERCFAGMTSTDDTMPDFLKDYLLSSKNCTDNQLKELINLAETAEHLKLIYENAISRETSAFETNDELFQSLFESAMGFGKSCISILKPMLSSKHAKESLDNIVHELRSCRLDLFSKEMYRTLAHNEFISPKVFFNRYSTNLPLLRELMSRKDLAEKMYAEELLQVQDDDMMAILLENHGAKFQWTQILIDCVFARIFDFGLVTSVSFASVPNIPLDSVDCLIDANDIARIGVSRRPDLTLPIIQKLYEFEEEEIIAGILANSENRQEKFHQFYNQNVKYNEAMATNIHLPDSIRKLILKDDSAKAFRSQRALALRNDISQDEINSLLQKRDLDIYHNICINKKIILNREQVLQLTSFAQVELEEQRQWLPCLKLTHPDKKEDEEELIQILYSYQSEMRLILQNLDKELGLTRIDMEMLISWTSDPDFSIIMGIINSVPNLSNYLIGLLLGNEANPGLLDDKLVALLKHSKDMSSEIIQEILNKGQPLSANKILRMISWNLKGEILFCLEKGNVDKRDDKSENINFRDPHKYVPFLRTIFEHHKADSDLMTAIVELLKSVISKYKEIYASNEEHLRTRIDDLLLDLATDFQVDRDVIDSTITVATKTLMCHILNAANLNHDTIWSIYLKEALSCENDTASPVMRCLALRANLPSDLRFTMALLQSKIGNTNSDDMEIDDKNELLHLIISTGSKLPSALVHYYIEKEPKEIVNFLHSSELDAEELKFIVQNVLPKLTQYDDPVRSHFETFINSVSALTGCPMTLDDIDFNVINSRVINSAITYARGGIELQLLPEFLTKTLGLKIPTDQMQDLLTALQVLFRVKKKEKKPEKSQFPAKSIGENSNEQQEEEVPVTSLPCLLYTSPSPRDA